MSIVFGFIFIAIAQLVIAGWLGHKSYKRGLADGYFLAGPLVSTDTLIASERVAIWQDVFNGLKDDSEN